MSAWLRRMNEIAARVAGGCDQLSPPAASAAIFLVSEENQMPTGCATAMPTFIARWVSGVHSSSFSQTLLAHFEPSSSSSTLKNLRAFWQSV